MQLIKADDERKHETRWSCVACLPALFRTMAASVESAVLIEFLKKIGRDVTR